jgi:hypothetical protein
MLASRSGDVVMSSLAGEIAASLQGCGPTSRYDVGSRAAERQASLQLRVTAPKRRCWPG